MELEYLSASRIKMYTNCSAQYYFKYIENLPTQPNSNLIQGSSVHKALEKNYVQKIESEQDLEFEEITSFYCDVFEKGSEEIDWKNEGLEKKKDKGKLKDQGVNMVTCYHENFSPQIKPLEVEKEFILNFKNRGYKFKGFIDVYTKDKVVIDHKTTKTKQIKDNDKMQGIFYCLAKGAEEFTLNYVTKHVNTQCYSHTQKINNSDKKHALFMLDKVASLIEQEVFYPNRDGFLCSRKYCDFWSECEKKYGGSVKE